jgi:hypothetical protein
MKRNFGPNEEPWFITWETQSTLVSKSLTLPKIVHDGFLSVNKK